MKRTREISPSTFQEWKKKLDQIRASELDITETEGRSSPRGKKIAADCDRWTLGHEKKKLVSEVTNLILTGEDTCEASIRQVSSSLRGNERKKTETKRSAGGGNGDVLILGNLSSSRAQLLFFRLDTWLWVIPIGRLGREQGMCENAAKMKKIWSTVIWACKKDYIFHSFI